MNGVKEVQELLELERQNSFKLKNDFLAGQKEKDLLQVQIDALNSTIE